ncbi:MAG: UDP-N-acetylmuramoyl-L-alanine--D-glutamate ligase [Bacteroidota bacterium]
MSSRPEKAIILGAGESGVGAALLAVQYGWDVWVSDFGTISPAHKQELEENYIPYEEGKHSIESFFDAQVVIKSPGIPQTVPVIRALREKNIPIVSEIEFASHYCGAKIIAITGTNGKTTTTSLIFHVLEKAGEEVAVGGNIGESFARLLTKDRKKVYVLELSSFQLEDIDRFHPNIALLLNVTPDHLDRYEGDIRKYGQTKIRIGMNQTSDDVFICENDSSLIQELQEEGSLKAKVLKFGENKAGADIWWNGQNVETESGESWSSKDWQLLGKHNVRNIMAAILALKEYGLSDQQIREGLADFRPIVHRLETIDRINGIRFINDSKATNVEAVYYALEGMDEPLIWIAGGVDKGNDYSSILELVEEKVKTIIVLGQGYEKFSRQFKKPMFQANSMSQAIALAAKGAEKGETVLLSPACASFDLFKNYIDRGEQFRAEVEKWKATLKN